MAKLDGMDPKLVREMLAQIHQAAKQMDAIEARVTQLTRTAGVSVRATHRPSQIADAGSAMVKDVTARLALLEKKEKQSGGKGEKGGSGKAPTGKDSFVDGDTTRPADDPDPKGDAAKPKGHDDKPNHKSDDPKPKAEPKGDDHKPKAEPKGHDDKPSDSPSHAKPHDLGDDAKPKDEPKSDDHKPKAEPKGHDDKPSDSPSHAKPHDLGDDTKPKAEPKGHDDKPSSDRPSDARPQDTGDDARSSAEPKGDDPTAGASGHDDKPSGDRPTDTRSYDTGDSPSSWQKPDEAGNDGGPTASTDNSKIYDTPQKDHPDDIDQTVGRQVIVEDGVKVVSAPVNQPADDSSVSIVGPHPDGPPGYVEPLEPAQGASDPPADYVGTAADNVSDDPAARSNPVVTDPASTNPVDLRTVSADPAGTGSWSDRLGPESGSTYSAGTSPGSADPVGTGAVGSHPAGATSVSADPAGAGSWSDRLADHDSPSAYHSPPGPVTGMPEDAVRAGGSDLSTTGLRDGGGDAGSGSASDPRSLAAAQPEVVLSIPTDALDPSVLRTLVEHHREIEPLDMPNVILSAGEGDTGECARTIGPDGPPGSVDPKGPNRPIPPGS